MQTIGNTKSNIMKRILFVMFILIFLLSGQQINADTKKIVNSIAKTIEERLFEKNPEKNIKTKEEFPGFEEFQSFKGDINNDKKADKIVIYEKECSKDDKNTIENSKCRRVAIFLNVNNKYKLFGFNDNLVECSQCGGAGVGDPFQSVIIRNGYFSVKSLYGACDKTSIVATFRYDKLANNFYLNKVRTENYSCKERPENGEISVKTKVESAKAFGKIKFTNYGKQNADVKLRRR